MEVEHDVSCLVRQWPRGKPLGLDEAPVRPGGWVLPALSARGLLVAGRETRAHGAVGGALCQGGPWHARRVARVRRVALRGAVVEGACLGVGPESGAADPAGLDGPGYCREVTQLRLAAEARRDGGGHWDFVWPGCLDLGGAGAPWADAMPTGVAETWHVVIYASELVPWGRVVPGMTCPHHCRWPDDGFGDFSFPEGIGLIWDDQKRGRADGRPRHWW